MESNEQITFEQNTLLQSYKAANVDRLVSVFKESFRVISLKQHHRIRAHIFSNPIMKNTKYLSCEIKAVHHHTDYHFADQYQAAILLTCSTYHPIHIRYIAEEISESGKFQCRQCKTKCLQIEDIVVDSLLWAFHKLINHYQGCILIVCNKEIGQLMEEKMRKEAQASRDKIVLVEREEKGVIKSKLIQVRLLQLARDDDLHLQVERICQKIEQAKSQAAQTYKQKYLNNCSIPILTNTVCFYSKVRIRNPLINKQCLPITHNHRLIVYSYQNVYFSLFEAQTRVQKVCCRYPGCSNYLDRHNFEQNAIVIQEMQSGYYQQDRQNLMGMYFMNKYLRDWQINTKQQTISQSKSNSQQQVDFKQLKARVEELLSTANLKEAASRTNKLVKKLLKAEIEMKMSQYDAVCDVRLGEMSVCPVRCLKCSSLDTMDVYSVASVFEREKRCSLCGQWAKKKQFYDVFYIDLQLMQFIYLQGFNHTVSYDLVERCYFHRLEYYTGQSLRHKLIAENRVVKRNQNMADFQLGETKTAIIDRNCLLKSTPQKIVEHLCIIDEKQELCNLKCSKCVISLKVHRLLLCQIQKSQAKQQSNIDKQHSIDFNSKAITQQTGLSQKQAGKNIHHQVEIKSALRKFPTQFTNLLKKKQQTMPLPHGSVSFEGLQTQGNLLLFNYPVRSNLRSSIPADLLNSKIAEHRQRV